MKLCCCLSKKRNTFYTPLINKQSVDNNDSNIDDNGQRTCNVDDKDRKYTIKSVNDDIFDDNYIKKEDNTFILSNNDGVVKPKQNKYSMHGITVTTNDSEMLGDVLDSSATKVKKKKIRERNKVRSPQTEKKERKKKYDRKIERTGFLLNNSLTNVVDITPNNNDNILDKQRTLSESELIKKTTSHISQPPISTTMKVVNENDSNTSRSRNNSKASFDLYSSNISKESDIMTKNYESTLKDIQNNKKRISNIEEKDDTFLNNNTLKNGTKEQQLLYYYKEQIMQLNKVIINMRSDIKYMKAKIQTKNTELSRQKLKIKNIEFYSNQLTSQLNFFKKTKQEYVDKYNAKCSELKSLQILLDVTNDEKLQLTKEYNKLFKQFHKRN